MSKYPAAEIIKDEAELAELEFPSALVERMAATIRALWKEREATIEWDKRLPKIWVIDIEHPLGDANE